MAGTERHAGHNRTGSAGIRSAQYGCASPRILVRCRVQRTIRLPRSSRRLTAGLSRPVTASLLPATDAPPSDPSGSADVRCAHSNVISVPSPLTAPVSVCRNATRTALFSPRAGRLMHLLSHPTRVQKHCGSAHGPPDRQMEYSFSHVFRTGIRQERRSDDVSAHHQLDRPHSHHH